MPVLRFGAKNVGRKGMAWDDILRSVFRASKILGKELTEQDLPANWLELKRLHESLWNEIYNKRRVKCQSF